MLRICAQRGLWRACLRSGVCVLIPFSKRFWSNRNLIDSNMSKVGTGRARSVRFACLLVCSARSAFGGVRWGLRVCGSGKFDEGVGGSNLGEAVWVGAGAGASLRQAGGASEGAEAGRRGGAEAAKCRSLAPLARGQSRYARFLF